jgi:hypothetical protein
MKMEGVCIVEARMYVTVMTWDIQPLVRSGVAAASLQDPLGSVYTSY